MHRGEILFIKATEKAGEAETAKTMHDYYYLKKIPDAKKAYEEAERLMNAKKTILEKWYGLYTN